MTRILRRAVCAALASSSLLALAVPAAQAGTYTVLSCRDRDWRPVPIADASGGWRHESGPRPATGLSLSDQCGNGDFLQIAAGGAESFGDPYVYSQAIFRPPSDTRISDFDLYWDGYGVPQDASKVGFLVVDTNQSRYAELIGSGDTGDRHTWARDVDASYVLLQTGCQAGNVACGGTSAGGDARARLQRSEVKLVDEATPTGTVYGASAGRAVWTGPQTVTVDAEDRGSGVYSVAVKAGTQVGPSRSVDGNSGWCAERGGERTYGVPRPCKLDPAAVDVPIDPAAWPDGTHEVRVRVLDAAGNVRELPLGEKVFDNRPPVVEGEASVSGTGREGDPLTCVAPVISGQSPTIAYDWSRVEADGSNRTAIDGATADTYTPTSADVGRKLVCRVTATDGGGSASGESSLVSGPFSDGRTVRGICDGMPTGPKDPCGDLDGDGRRNRDDTDADGDGVAREHDPDDHDAARTGRDTAPPSDQATGSNATTTHTVVNTTTTTTERTVESSVIPDGAAGQPNGRFASPAATLSSTHEGTSSRTIRVGHGRRLVIAGRLLAPDGTPIQGAKLDVTTQDRTAGAQFKPFGAVLTEADGRYRFILPPGPSRTVRVGYRARFGDTAFAQTSDLVVLVRAGLQFRLSHKRLRNGRTVRYSGRILGPRSGHRFAEVMVRVGRRWIVVCSVRTDGKGAFGCRHRFTKTFTRTRYVFRARVRRQASLPYEPATSATRALVVRPR